jgi:hypothetical protein
MLGEVKSAKSHMYKCFLELGVFGEFGAVR